MTMYIRERERERGVKAKGLLASTKNKIQNVSKFPIQNLLQARENPQAGSSTLYNKKAISIS